MESMDGATWIAVKIAGRISTSGLGAPLAKIWRKFGENREETDARRRVGGFRLAVGGWRWFVTGLDNPACCRKQSRA